MGRSCFETECVTGYSRVPEPPARMIPLREQSVILCRRGLSTNIALQPSSDTPHLSLLRPTPCDQGTIARFCESQWRMFPEVANPDRVRSCERQWHSADHDQGGLLQR